MTTAFHAKFTPQINVFVRDKIEDLQSSSNDATKKFPADSKGGCGGRVSLNSSAYQCPDEQYSVESRKIPGVVVEVAFSQSIKNLSAKAINYLTLSNDCILVIGLDASYCI
jgi:hypothetical protein